MKKIGLIVLVLIIVLAGENQANSVDFGPSFNFFVEQISVDANSGLSYTDDFEDGIFGPPHPSVPNGVGYGIDPRSTISNEDEYDGRLSLNSGDAVWAGPGNQDWVMPIDMPVTSTGPNCYCVVPTVHFGDFSFTAIFVADPLHRPRPNQDFSIGLFSTKEFGFFEEHVFLEGVWAGICLEDEQGDIAFVPWSNIQPSNTVGLRLIIDSEGFITAEYNVDGGSWTVFASHVAPLDTDREYCAALAGGAEPATSGLDLSGEYWFGSLSVDANSWVPWGKQGTVIINSNNWYQEWDDYDGHHSYSGTFTTSVQPDGSININHAWGSYNVAWNGNVMVHADTGPDAENHLGFDVIARKATNVDVNDVIGSYAYFGHWLGWSERYGSVEWGTVELLADGNYIYNGINDDNEPQFETGTWELDDVNATVLLSIIGQIEQAELALCAGGILIHFVPIPGPLGNGDDETWYDFFVKETNEPITPDDIAGTYTVRFLETSVFGQPFTCGKGTAIIKPDGTLKWDAYYSYGEHDVDEITYTLGPGNKISFPGDPHEEEGIISPDKSLIFIVEYADVLPEPQWWNWIGGIFLVRTTCNVTDLNQDKHVNFADYRIFAEEWLRAEPGLSANFNRDSGVDWLDLKLFAENWLWEASWY